MISEAIHFDLRHSIIVFNYLNDYCDLSNFYEKENIFPTAIAASIGASLATTHRLTIDCQEYKNFFSHNCEDILVDEAPNFLSGLERIEPEIYGVVSSDNLKFFELYQCYESLGQSIAELNTAFEPCCLSHAISYVCLYCYSLTIRCNEPTSPSISSAYTCSSA